MRPASLGQFSESIERRRRRATAPLLETGQRRALGEALAADQHQSFLLALGGQDVGALQSGFLVLVRNAHASAATSDRKLKNRRSCVPKMKAMA